jgi:hypothetical protein
MSAINTWINSDFFLDGAFGLAIINSMWGWPKSQNVLFYSRIRFSFETHHAQRNVKLSIVPSVYSTNKSIGIGILPILSMYNRFSPISWFSNTVINGVGGLCQSVKYQSRFAP